VLNTSLIVPMSLRLVVFGNLTLNAAASISITFASASAPSPLTVSGCANLGGHLTISVLNTAPLSNSGTVTALTIKPCSGTSFRSVKVNLPPGSTSCSTAMQELQPSGQLVIAFSFPTSVPAPSHL